MNELFYVIQREYLTRVRAKSFIVITLLTPLLLSSLFFLPSYFAGQHEDYKQLKIGLINHTTHALNTAFDESELTVELLEKQTIEDIRNLILTDTWEGIAYVSQSDSTETSIQYYSGKQPSVFLLNQLKSAIQKVVVNEKLAVLGIENIEELIHAAGNSVVIESIKVDEQKTETVNSPYQRPLCMALGITVYMFIFLFSSQVMRGVLEEKSNRIVELIITSISPVKFMAGKIIGIALLSLTQIICWLVILYGLSLFMSNSLDMNATENFMSQRISQEDINQILTNLNQIDFNTIIPAFLFFFIGGYLLYSSVFAAIAATANHSDEIQQVTMIVTLPLILSILILANTVNSPDSALSYWFSMIPFTSPVIMMGRVVYGVPLQDIVLSMTILLATVGVVIWLSGKVYRMAILHTGKKISINQILFWIKNTNK